MILMVVTKYSHRIYEIGDGNGTENEDMVSGGDRHIIIRGESYFPRRILALT